MIELVNVVVDDSGEEKGTDAPASPAISDQQDDVLEIEKEVEDNSKSSNSETNVAQPKKGPSIR
ncbi:hypothetical protein A2U01_0086889, partial [Trifolium medium]|nr:hypothetical protein [Trifolium medium]